MKVLCVCNRGVSRSPTIAALLTNKGHDALAVGSDTASFETRRLLSGWCEMAIFTDPSQIAAFPDLKVHAEVWPVADCYPRPFNKDLHALVLRLIESKGL